MSGVEIRKTEEKYRKGQYDRLESKWRTRDRSRTKSGVGAPLIPTPEPDRRNPSQACPGQYKVDQEASEVSHGSGHAPAQSFCLTPDLLDGPLLNIPWTPAA